MRVLVTGATGFVGASIVRALLRHGHAVLGSVRDLAKGRALHGDRIELASGDMWLPETYTPLVSRVDAVIHAAQQQPRGRWSQRKIADLHRSDAIMARALAQSCLEQNKPLIYTSGALTHAGQGEQWIDETAPAHPCLLARGHSEMVQELLAFHRDRGLRVTIISPGYVYGDGGFLKMTAEMICRNRYRIIGRGCNYVSLVHQDDVGEAYALALTRGRKGECYFLADDAPLRLREMIDRLADALLRPRVGRVPIWLMSPILGSPMIEAINASVRIRSAKARRDLGWQPRYATFDEGLPAVLEALGHGAFLQPRS